MAAAATLSSAAALPDGRVWEQVSPVEKYGTDAPLIDTISTGITRAGFDGDGIAYSSSGAYADAPVATVMTYYGSHRTRDGWITRALTPPMRGVPLNPTNDLPMMQAFSSDASAAVLTQNVAASTPLVEGAPASDGALYRNPAGGPLSWLSAPRIPAATQPRSIASLGGAPDLSSVVFQANPTNHATGTVKLIPEDAPRVAGAGMYEIVADDLRPVGVLPDGTLPDHGAVSALDSTMTPGRFNNNVSSDGSRILFVSPDPAAGSPEVRQLYMRIDGKRTVLVSRSELTGLPSTSANKSFEYASPDGSKVWFTTAEQLTGDSPPSGARRIYEFDVATENLTYLPDLGVPFPSNRTGEPLMSSHDGSRFVYLKPGTNELWLSDRGQVSLVARAVDLSDTGNLMLRAAVDGSRFVFESSSQVRDASDGVFDNAGGFTQVYVYDVASARLSCASCPLEGALPRGDAGFGWNWAPSWLIATWTTNRGMTDDGSRVFFDTVEALVPQDGNNRRDVYEWNGPGQYKLLSAGTGQYDSFYMDNSETGGDVFFATRDALAVTDIDGGVMDVYDARVGGGFPLPPPDARCMLDCQGPRTDIPFIPVPSTIDFDGTGNVEDPEIADPRFSASKVSRRARKRLAKTGRVAIRVRQSAAGNVTARLSAKLGKRWVRSSAASKYRTRGGTSKLTLRLSKKAKRRLANKRRLRIRIDIRYSESDVARLATFVVRAPKARRAQAKARRAR